MRQYDVLQSLLVITAAKNIQCPMNMKSKSGERAKQKKTWKTSQTKFRREQKQWRTSQRCWQRSWLGIQKGKAKRKVWLKSRTLFFLFLEFSNQYLCETVTPDTSTCTAHHQHEMRYRKPSPAMLSSYNWTLATIVGFPVTKSKSQYPALVENAI